MAKTKVASPVEDRKPLILVELYEALVSVVEATNVSEQFWRVPKVLERYEREYGKISSR